MQGGGATTDISFSPPVPKTIILNNGYGRRNPSLSSWESLTQEHAHDYKFRFCGHSNAHTDIKEASYVGDRGEYIVAGSDDGNIFFWEKATGRIVRVLHGDDSIVNCVQWHPSGPLLASSGIENIVRLWEPKQAGKQVWRIYYTVYTTCTQTGWKTGMAT